MNGKTLIERQADRFFEQEDFSPTEGQMGSYVKDTFRSKLQVSLYDYDDNVDKITFLYRLLHLIEQALEDHKPKCTGGENCPLDSYYNEEKFFTEQELKKLNPDFDYSIRHPSVDADLIKSNMIQLSNYPEVAKLYQSSLDKFRTGHYERNLVDDLRLALETLLKQILANSYPLEKQKEPLGQFLVLRETSVDIRNLITSTLTYYAKFQNENIKHNDVQLKSYEVELLLNLTSTLINFIVNSQKN